MQLVRACDEAGSPSIGTAAMISWFWMLRETDVLTRFDWTKYQPEVGVARVWHHKTGADVEIPLFDDDGSELWPELSARLAVTPRLGTLVVMRDQPDTRRGIHLPWNEHTFRHRLKEIRDAAASLQMPSSSGSAMAGTPQRRTPNSPMRSFGR